MVGLRGVLCPLILWAAHAGLSGQWLAFMVFIALVDDVYDGILARRWNCDTPALRLYDSIADTIFYLGVLGALWLRKPEILRSDWVFFATLLTLEGARYVVDFRKFGKAASYHSYMAKAWGLLLASAMVGVFAFDNSKYLVLAGLFLGIAVNLEGLAMSLILPHWKNDVRTLAKAWKLRQQMLAEEPVSH